MDVTKSADWKSTMEAVMKSFGRCDILVNNAGWSYTNKATTGVTEEEFERVFDVNVKGVYLGCNAWVDQAIKRNEGGVIINIASVGATRPRPGLVWYNASKGAVWNVSLPPTCATQLIHVDIHVLGNKRPRRRIRPSQYPRSLHLPIINLHRSVLRIHGHGRYSREQAKSC